MKRVNFVTLGVKDLKKSKAFFKTLFGWKPTAKKSDDIAFYDMGGWILSLFPLEALAQDAKVSAKEFAKSGGFPGITLAHNVREKSEVKKVLAKAEKSGGRIVKPAEDAFWGGHSGYFQDLNGHYWEVAWNPMMPTLEDGTLKITHE